jgi:hypothetical protein
MMTSRLGAGYAQRVMNGWQRTGAFVIQFHPQKHVKARRLEGRVEHVASSQAVHFHSLEELLSFLDRILNEARANQQAQT